MQKRTHKGGACRVATASPISLTVIGFPACTVRRLSLRPCGACILFALSALQHEAVKGAKLWADFANPAIITVSALITMADFHHFSALHWNMLHLRAHTFAPLTRGGTMDTITYYPQGFRLSDHTPQALQAWRVQRREVSSTASLFWRSYTPIRKNTARRKSAYECHARQ